MAEQVVSFGVNKLWDLLSRESVRLRGVDKEVDKLKSELRMLQSLLEDAYAKKHDSKRLKSFLEKVKDIVYDAEDIIESFLLNENGGEEKGIKKRVKRFACFLVDRRGFASDVEQVTERISKVIGGMQSLRIQQLIDGGRSLSLQDRQREIRRTYPNSSESDFVGMEQSVEELVVKLVGDNSVHNVISISGMGGIGKTTLARQVFHHDTARHHFDGFAWVCASQQFTPKDVWQSILQDLRPHDKDILQMNEYKLHGELFQLLQNGRYLIVLDDLWTKQDWERIKPAFPAKRGWKMLLTSRNESVGLHADPTCFAFRPRILTLEQSWMLCERIVLTRRNEIELRVDEELETMGKKMVAYCGGLPLAIRVLGGLLAEKRTVSEWKRVYDNIGAQIVGKYGLDDSNPHSVNQVLSLSYEELPVQLKQCFLYLAHFPEDRKIDVEKLYHYWASDGILTPSDDALTIRYNGEDYLEELVRRNMVIAKKSNVHSRFEYCQMHDMMREVCLSKAKEENFVRIVSKATASTSIISAQSDPSRSRRLAVHIDDASKVFGRKHNKKVRSVLCLDVRHDSMIQSNLDIQSLPLLRVLDLSGVKFEGGKLPSSIGELIHLRFLSLYCAEVSHLPSSLRNLKLLLYLNLLVNSGVAVPVPNYLKEMVELRYLYLPLDMDDKTKLELGGLVNLEFLKNFSTIHSNVTDLCGMTKLRDLGVKIGGGCTYETLSSSLLQLENLETFSLESSDHEEEFVLDLIQLKELYLKIRMPRLPAQQQMPPQLAKIELFYCEMKEDPMPILEKLLHLKLVSLVYGAFVGRRMVCSKGGFPQLCVLEIFDLEELEEWIIEEGSMSCLHTVGITGCKKLKELPDGIKYIASLKELEILDMKREFKEKLETGGEDYYKIQHIPNVQFIGCDEDE